MTAGQEHDVEVLGVYVLGLLDDDVSRVVEAHLAACAHCCVVVGELEWVHELLVHALATDNANLLRFSATRAFVPGQRTRSDRERR